jgi:hypothetical protein
VATSGLQPQAVIELLDNELGALTTKQIHEKLGAAHTDAQIRNALNRLLKSRSDHSASVRGSYQSTKISLGSSHLWGECEVRREREVRQTEFSLFSLFSVLRGEN